MTVSWKLSIPLNQAIADLILEQVSGGKSLREICSVSWMPPEDSVRNWIANYPEFRSAYEAAVLIRVHNYVDECISIADTVVPDTAAIAKANMMIKTRQWLASKIDPAKFGNNVDVNVGNKGKEAFVLKMIAGDDKL